MNNHFETDRLYLRELSLKDASSLANINLSPLVMEFFPSVLNYDETLNFIHKANSHFKKYGFGFPNYWSSIINFLGDCEFYYNCFEYY